MPDLRQPLRALLVTFGFLGLAGIGRSAPPPTLAIAAAADLQAALGEMKAAFAKAHPGTEVAITYGSSGNFYTQLMSRAPFDLFLSADLDYPKKLVAAGLADGSTLFHYSRGRLVLWVPKGSPIPLEQLGMQALLHPAARKVAIANPRHAPYGRAAEAALAKLGLLEAVRPRLVFGENIAQTAQFVQTGAADIGLLALSLAKAPNLAAAGRAFEVPLAAYPALDQGGVLLNHARNRAAALAFRDFLRSPEGAAILRRYGFTTEDR
ncbi:molybdate ABC transporter substrate-binding protein [Geothrix edaphica]|uniref:Molybdate ABC transporter substrate-binding protein n=1 Tax=Geothrix edaphica TaxID=2927976 RepID=A0ABQ5PYT7_9BACT|nr:molybdate ABC transporter substrate-binding protein [Geothrix edaphica]GLH67546.1 molybdate ABC transporter substrate-binding protein [Geothrix edaphica]